MRSRRWLTSQAGDGGLEGMEASGGVVSQDSVAWSGISPRERARKMNARRRGWACSGCCKDILDGICEICFC